MHDPILSVQLYSLRRETSLDAAATLRAVPGLGFDGIELAGDYGWDAGEWRNLLKETGLSVVGAHVGLHVLEADFEKEIHLHTAIGNTRIISFHSPRVSQPGGICRSGRTAQHSRKAARVVWIESLLPQPRF